MSVMEIWVKTLIKALENASEPIKAALKETVTQLEKKAQATPNPWDNLLVSLLKVLLCIEEEK